MTKIDNSTQNGGKNNVIKNFRDIIIALFTINITRAR